MPTDPTLDPRSHLVRALEADLIGPFTLEPSSTETLPIAPSHWYLTGFLAPQFAMPEDEALQEGEQEPEDDEVDVDDSLPEQAPKGPRMFPASIGLSVLLPPAKITTNTVNVTLRYAEYKAVADGNNEGMPRAASIKLKWTRVPKEPITVDLSLNAKALEVGREIAPGLFIQGHLGVANARGLKEGTRALALFVVNKRPLPAERRFDESFIFQVTLEVRHPGGLVARPNCRDELSGDEDEKLVDLQFRNHFEWAVGHGVAVEPIEENGEVVGARSNWLPMCNVPRVETLEIKAVTTSMDVLAEEVTGAVLKERLGALVERYGEWIAERRDIPLGSGEGDESSTREQTREMLVHRANTAKNRIAAGIELLAKDDEVREAFRLTNRAMAEAARQRSPERYTEQVPCWRLFQLAFLLLNLESMACPTSDQRFTVELLFFPTGGGKTEAYLGIIAFTVALRRLRGQTRPDAGLGVAVLLRYTLRLLTLDQLGRAATLICALERLRQKQPERLGRERFSIGLWVGRGATANTLAQAVEEIRDYKLLRGASPFPLPSCPWCHAELTPQCLTTEPAKKPERVIVGCSNIDCAFSCANNPEGLPVLFVDEQLYRELPCFVVATVDKLAMLPWRGRTAALFGQVHSRSGKDFFSVMDSPAPTKGAMPLPNGLSPLDLIVQDELHLISGPLGTMVGLYETAILELSTRLVDGKRVSPKIVASTATARRAHQQVRSLFGRDSMQVFPPSGLDDAQTFFASVDKKNSGRLYIGVAAPGRAMKTLLIRTYISLLGATQRLFEASEVPRKVADAYMTLIGYFNSLRELGGMRRLLEDEIRVRTAKDDNERVPIGFDGANPWVRRREIKYEPEELTSRETTAAVAAAKRALETAHPSENQVDVALASNMISVGLDIDRLGLMVIAGQPKTTSEYIQSSSRVGRDKERPGLVVTVFNVFRSRDRSHYERFGAYHRSFYRFVEATSVTPFSAPALDRGLAAVLVTMTRLGNSLLTPPEALTHLEQVKRDGFAAIQCIAQKAANEHEDCSPEDADNIRATIERIGKNLLSAWEQAVGEGNEGGVTCYSGLEKTKGTPLLFGSLDKDVPAPTTQRGKFAAGTSMRDVEASVHLWKSKIRLNVTEDDHER